MKQIPSKKPKAIIFDVDKTLTERVTWYLLTEALGGNSCKHAELYTNLMAGKISLLESKKKLLNLWATEGKPHRKKIEDIFLRVHLRGEAHATLSELQDKGYKLCLISSSITMFIERVAKKFNIEHYYANASIVFDKKGFLKDINYFPNQAELKVEQFEDFLKKTKLKKEDCIAVGDDDNDVLLFQTIPGIAVNSNSDHLRQLAWKEIKYLPRISQLIESIK